MLEPNIIKGLGLCGEEVYIASHPDSPAYVESHDKRDADILFFLRHEQYKNVLRGVSFLE